MESSKKNKQIDEFLSNIRKEMKLASDVSWEIERGHIQNVRNGMSVACSPNDTMTITIRINGGAQRIEL